MEVFYGSCKRGRIEPEIVRSGIYAGSKQEAAQCFLVFCLVWRALASCAAGWLGQSVNFALGWLQHLLARGLQQAKRSLVLLGMTVGSLGAAGPALLALVGLGCSVGHPRLLDATCTICTSEGVAVSLLVSPVWRTYSWWQLPFHPGWCGLKSWFVWNKGWSVLYVDCFRVACLRSSSVEAEAVFLEPSLFFWA